MIIVFGSKGTATFDIDGTAIENGDYPEIDRINVAEWRATYPGEDPEKRSHDVLDWGFWSKDGTYTPPEEDWRVECRRNI